MTRRRISETKRIEKRRRRRRSFFPSVLQRKKVDVKKKKKKRTICVKWDVFCSTPRFWIALFTGGEDKPVEKCRVRSRFPEQNVFILKSNFRERRRCCHLSRVQLFSLVTDTRKRREKNTRLSSPNIVSKYISPVSREKSSSSRETGKKSPVSKRFERRRKENGSGKVSFVERIIQSVSRVAHSSRTS